MPRKRQLDDVAVLEDLRERVAEARRKRKSLALFGAREYTLIQHGIELLRDSIRFREITEDVPDNYPDKS